MQMGTPDVLDDYFNVRIFASDIAGTKVEFVTKPGLPAWEQVPPSASLVAKLIEFQQPRRVLHLGCGNGALTAWLASNLPEAEVYYTDLLEPCHQMTRLTLENNRLDNATPLEPVDIPEDLCGRFDLVIMLLPKGRALARRWLVLAFQALRPAGELYLAGPNNEGIRSVLKDAGDLFGAQPVLGYKKGCRLARFFKSTDHEGVPAWTSESGIQPGTWMETAVTVNGQTYQLRSLPGVFAADRLDEGTQLLLENADLSPTEQILDLGCGSGIIGLVAAAQKLRVDLVDANRYAVATSRENLKTHANARVFAGDLIQPVSNQRYNRILTNPPFHSGKAVDYDLARAFVAGAARLLYPEGELWLVANRFLPYLAILKTYFPAVQINAETGKYTLYQARKL